MGNPALPRHDVDWRGKAFQYQEQRGYRGQSAHPGAFVAIPEVVADRIGLTTHMGARLEAACLSRLLYEHEARAEGEREIEFKGYEEPFLKREGRFVLSIESVARDLWARWYHEMRTRDDDAFKRFYERVRKSVARLVSAGWIQREGNPHGKRTLGVVWTFDGTWFQGINDLGVLRYTGTCLTSSAIPNDGYLGDGTMNVVDVIGSVFTADNPAEFTQTEGVSSLTHRGRGNYTHLYSWYRAFAERGTPRERYASIGAWRPGEEGRADKPVLVPWVTFDIDRDGDLREALDVTQRILDNLSGLYHIPLRKVHVSFSGSKGFHIRVPIGVFGAPVFADGATAERTLRVVTETIADETIDLSVCNPRQNIRLPGSGRRSGMRVVTWMGDEFQGLSLLSILEQAREHKWHWIGHLDPASVAAVPEAVELMVNASDVGRGTPLPDYFETEAFDPNKAGSGVAQRALQGVDEGEVWWDKGGKFHCGRSKAMFVAACHLLRKHKGSSEKAWRELVEANERNVPAMTDKELRGRMESAERTLARSGEVRRR